MLLLFDSVLNASYALEFSCSVNIAAEFIMWKEIGVIYIFALTGRKTPDKFHLS